MRQTPVHKSLYQPQLMAGIHRSHAIFLGALGFLTLLLGGFHLLPLVLVAFLYLVAHPALVYLTKLDSLALEVFFQSLAYRDYYLPHASVLAWAPRPPRSLPPPPKAFS